MNILFKILKPYKIKFYLLLLIIFSFTLNIITLSSNYLSITLDKNIINKEDNRIIYISSKKSSNEYKIIKKIPNIQQVFYNSEPVLAKSELLGATYLKYKSPTEKIKKVQGRISNLKSNEIVIPQALLKKNNIANKDIINKKILFRIDNHAIDFIVVGIYQSKNNQYIYVSNNSNINQYSQFSNKYILIITDRKKLNDIENQLNKYQISIDYINDSSQNESQTYQDILNILNGFITICYVVLIVIYLILLYSTIKEKEYSIALLKSLGYSYYLILVILLCNFINIMLLSACISLCFIKVIDILLIEFQINNFLNLNIILWNFIIMLLTLILILISSLQKIKKINIIKLIKNS